MSDESPEPPAPTTQGPNCCVTAAATFGMVAAVAVALAGALARAVSART